MAGKLLSYQVIEAEGIDFLVEIVRREIGSGWKPIGGIQIHNDKFYQTMIYKRKK